MSAASAQPTEEEIRAYEEQLSRIGSVEMVLQATASLISIGGRRLGLAPGSEQERDLEQVRDAIDAVRALLPIAERRVAPAQVRPLRDALSQMQMAYAQLVGAEGGGQAAEAAGAQSAGGQSGAGPGDEAGPQGSPATGRQPPAAPAQSSDRPADQRGPGPAESSGRLWVPGR